VGPLFSLGLLFVLAMPVVLILFLVAKIFLPWRGSFMMAVFPTLAGAAGFAVAAIGQIPFYPSDLGSSGLVALYMGISCLAGILAAILTGAAVLRRSRQAPPV
jgi:hypothetical protein